MYLAYRRRQSLVGQSAQQSRGRIFTWRHPQRLDEQYFHKSSEHEVGFTVVRSAARARNTTSGAFGEVAVAAESTRAARTETARDRASGGSTPRPPPRSAARAFSSGARNSASRVSRRTVAA